MWIRALLRAIIVSQQALEAGMQASARMLLSGGDTSSEGVMDGRWRGMFNVPGLP